jgi:hypothetical protein
MGVGHLNAPLEYRFLRSTGTNWGGISHPQGYTSYDYVSYSHHFGCSVTHIWFQGAAIREEVRDSDIKRPTINSRLALSPREVLRDQASS